VCATGCVDIHTQSVAWFHIVLCSRAARHTLSAELQPGFLQGTASVLHRSPTEKKNERGKIQAKTVVDREGGKSKRVGKERIMLRDRKDIFT
jgi:hypothetical protein